MEKVFKFVDSLTPSLIDLLGYPTIKVHSDFNEVCFKTDKVLKSVSFLNLPSDEYSLYADASGYLCIVFIFYKS